MILSEISPVNLRNVSHCSPIEFIAEMLGRELDARPHPLALGLCHLTDPAILQRPQDDERRTENRE